MCLPQRAPCEGGNNSQRLDGRGPRRASPLLPCHTISQRRGKTFCPSTGFSLLTLIIRFYETTVNDNFSRSTRASRSMSTAGPSVHLGFIWQGWNRFSVERKQWILMVKTAWYLLGGRGICAFGGAAQPSLYRSPEDGACSVNLSLYCCNNIDFSLLWSTPKQLNYYWM